jgi:hypothetical protein
MEELELARENAFDLLRWVGFDADVGDARHWCPDASHKHATLVSENDIERARQHLRESDPGRKYPDKHDRMHTYASYLLHNAEGRKVVRECLRNLSRENLLDLLGLG